MKLIRLPLLSSKILIHSDRRPLFNCVLKCHTISPKGEGQNLLSSYSVASTNFPASWLDNPNVCQFLILVHLPNSELHKILALYSYGRHCIERVLSQQSVHSSNGKLFGGRFGAHFYSASLDIRRMTNTFAILFTFSNDLLIMENK